MNWDFRRYTFSSLAAVKQKAKEGLERLGRGIVLRFSKTQPVRFWFLCAAGLRRLP